MAGNSAFVPINERGWRRGLRNLLRAGFAEWWATNKWWRQMLIWSAILGGLMAAMLYSSDAQPVEDVLGFVTIFGGIFPVVAVIIAMQGAIVGERQDGTAAWILSKPVSRTAYIVSKFVPNGVTIAVVALLVPMLVAALILRTAGIILTLPHLLGAFGVIALNMVFYLALTLMLGAMFKRRGGVIGVALAWLIGQQYLVGLLPPLGKVLPWGLVVPLSGSAANSVAGAVLTGNVPDSWLPVFATAVLSVVFLVLGIWRFRQVEL